MIELSDAAKEQLDGYFADKEKAAIRVFLAGGCCGPKLSLALDEAREGDTTYDIKGYSIVVENALLTTTGKLSIEMTEYGFSVDSENPIEGGGGGCSSGGCGSGGASAGGCGSGGCGCS